MGKLEGKVAVVTGASKGIGAGIAKGLAAEGAAVVVNYATSRADADRVVAEIVGAGGKAVAVRADVSKAADVERLFEETKKAFGSLDVLVNNAGVYQFAPLDVKLFGDNGGSVINIGSAASSITPPNSVVYTATKGAVDAVTGVLSKELGPRKIRVNSINPGVVDTEGTRAQGIPGSDFEKQLSAQTPLGRIGQPGDVAPVAVFLASAESAWVTGQILLASGGLQ